MWKSIIRRFCLILKNFFRRKHCLLAPNVLIFIAKKVISRSVYLHFLLVSKWLLCFDWAHHFFLYLFLLVILLLNLSVLCYQPSCFTVIVESTVTHTHPHVSSHERTAVLLRQITWTVKLKLDHLTLNMGQTTTNYHRKFTFSLHAEHIFMCLYSTFWNSPTFTNANVTRLLLLLKWTENFWGQ